MRSHDELIYSHPWAHVNTGTLECDVIMRDKWNGHMTCSLTLKKPALITAETEQKA